MTTLTNEAGIQKHDRRVMVQEKPSIDEWVIGVLHHGNTDSGSNREAIA